MTVRSRSERILESKWVHLGMLSFVIVCLYLLNLNVTGIMFEQGSINIFGLYFDRFATMNENTISKASYRRRPILNPMTSTWGTLSLTLVYDRGY